MRQFKHHEKKLLKKTDFYDWANISSMKKAEIVRRYRLRSRAEYAHFEKVIGFISRLGTLLRKLPQQSPFRKHILKQCLGKLFECGLLKSKEGTEGTLEKVTVSSLVRRRLIVMLKSLKFVETLREAELYVTQGHVMIGNEVVRDPNLLVSRALEDHVSWNDKSKIKRKVKRFNQKEDDFELY